MPLSVWTCTMASSSFTAVETPLFLGSAPSSSRRTPLRVSPVRATAFDASLSVDHHATLGVSFGASKLEIKRAYRRLARQFHPDVCKNGCSDQWFKHINHAYESLMNRSASSGRTPAASSVSIFCSEAGYRSLEELLNGSEVDGAERFWSNAEEGCDDTLIDCRWLEEEKPQESMDPSLFTTTACGEEADLESPWLKW